MMRLQEMCFLGVMSAGGWLWLLSLHPLCSSSLNFLCVSFPLGLVFSSFFTGFCAPSISFLSGFPCCLLLLHFGFAFISFLLLYSWTCKRSGLGCRSAESAVTFLGASPLLCTHPEHIVACSRIHHCCQGSRWAPGAGRDAVLHAQPLTAAQTVPKLCLQRAE